MPRPALFRRGAIALVLFAAALAIGYGAGALLNSGSSSTTASPGAITNDRLSLAVEGLCQAQTSATAGDIETARAAFLDKAHQFLHELASATQEKDPQAAGALLLAKYGVESRLSLPAGQPDRTPAATAEVVDGSQLSEALGRLVETVQSAATVLGLETPGCAD